jgi:hypothetical protein
MIPNFAIWASKNNDEGFTLLVLPSPNYKLTKSLKSNIQNISDFKRIVGRDWKPNEGTYVCYFDPEDIKVGTTIGSIMKDGTVIWYRNVESKIIDPSNINRE